MSWVSGVLLLLTSRGDLAQDSAELQLLVEVAAVDHLADLVECHILHDAVQILLTCSIFLHEFLIEVTVFFGYVARIRIISSLVALFCTFNLLLLSMITEQWLLIALESTVVVATVVDRILLGHINQFYSKFYLYKHN